MKKSSIFSYILLAVFGVVVVSVFLNLQGLSDWWFLRSYTPSRQIAILSSDSGMSNEGQRLFYLSDPVLNNKSSFNNNCPFPERTLVLGCFDGRNIFILKVDNKKLDGAEEVTAAHEMLHVAYQRLDEGERQKVDKLLQQQLDDIKDRRILGLVKEYIESDPESLNNELHSILPTELREMSAPLQDYYRQYFDDRSMVVDLAEDYAAVFNSLDSRIANFDGQIDALKKLVDTQEASLGQELINLENSRTELDQLLRAKQIDRYNQTVPTFNAQVTSYNDAVITIKLDIHKFNQLVVKRNKIALFQNELIKSLDSKYQPFSN